MLKMYKKMKNRQLLFEKVQFLKKCGKWQGGVWKDFWII